MFWLPDVGSLTGKGCSLPESHLVPPAEGDMPPTEGKGSGFWACPEGGQILLYRVLPSPVHYCSGYKPGNTRAQQWGIVRQTATQYPGRREEDSHGVGSRPGEIEVGRGKWGAMLCPLQRFHGEGVCLVASIAVGIGWVFLLFTLFCRFP